MSDTVTVFSCKKKYVFTCVLENYVNNNIFITHVLYIKPQFNQFSFIYVTHTSIKFLNFMYFFKSMIYKKNHCDETNLHNVFQSYNCSSSS